MIEHADDREQRGDELREALLQRLRDVVDVVRHAAQHVAAGVVVEVPSGRRASFSSTACRSRYTVRCATPAMMYCCSQAKAALSR